MTTDILIVDDEIDIRQSVGGILEDEGYTVHLAACADEAMDLAARRRPALVILDIWLQGSRKDGLGVLADLKAAYRDLPVVMFSGHGNLETAVRAIQEGAYDYIEKPFKVDRLLLVVARALEASRLKRENVSLREKIGQDFEMIAVAPAMRQVATLLKRTAPTNGRVFITGPTGVGKETAARFLHAHSPRSQGPFVVFSPAMWPEEGVDAAFFGREEGGEKGCVGALEDAHGGTLFLDNVTDFSPTAQAKLTRFLVDSSFSRVHGHHKITVDVRVIAASRLPMPAFIEEGAFREDLYHRLNVVPIVLPPLEDRLEDIAPLVDFFCRRYAHFSGHPFQSFSPDAIALLQARKWPGNVRQLKNYVERVLILVDKNQPEVGHCDLPADEEAPLAAALQGEDLIFLPLREAREAFEKNYLHSQLIRFGSNISKTANFIGMERSALHRKLKLLGIFSAREEEV